jgi:copper(I)-binding protein
MKLPTLLLSVLIMTGPAFAQGADPATFAPPPTTSSLPAQVVSPPALQDSSGSIQPAEPNAPSPTSSAPSATVAPVTGAAPTPVQIPDALQRRTSEQAGLPQADGIWARPAKLGGNTAVYMRLTGGALDDQLVAVTTPWAVKAEIHDSETDAQGVVRMKALPRLDVAAKSTVSFAPRGLHFMIFDLKRELKPGQFFPLILRFAKAGDVKVMVPVRQSAADTETSEHHHHMHHEEHSADPATVTKLDAAPSTSPTPPAHAHKH